MRLRSNVPILLLLMSCPMVGFVSCTETPISELPQDEGLARIKKSYDDKDWSQVTSMVDEYKNRYPYSKYTKEVELMQADSYYQLRKYPETIAVYENFVKKNPSDTNVGLANYRIAKSYDAQAPDNEDRDQSNSQRALQKYEEFLSSSKHTEQDWLVDAGDRKNALINRIANHDLFVAKFYWNQDEYAAALSRYLKIIKTYPELKDLVDNAKKMASKCYLELASYLKKNPKSEEYVYFKDATPETLEKNAQDILNN